MKILLIICTCLLSFSNLKAQSYKTTNGKVSFFSSAPVEDIKADNSKVSGIFDAQTGNLAFLVPINGFRFDKSLMQEHFNEKFLESHKYPEATFEGKLSGYNTAKTGTQIARANGNLTIHGLTVRSDIPGTIKFQDNQVFMEAKFLVKLEDHEIQIPKVLFYNIAEEVEVTVNFVLLNIEKP